jgi:hypothetical protein
MIVKAVKAHYKEDFIEIPGHVIEELNAGLALVTPFYLLNELLHTESAMRTRKDRPTVYFYTN